ncbi:MAG: hypothetical protein ABFD82_05415 [Syntrophaceae bacterium]
MYTACRGRLDFHSHEKSLPENCAAMRAVVCQVFASPTPFVRNVQKRHIQTTLSETVSRSTAFRFEEVLIDAYTLNDVTPGEGLWRVLQSRSLLF